LAIDCSEDDDFNIKGIENYHVVNDDDDPFDDILGDQDDDDHVEITEVEVISYSKDCIIDL